MRTRKRKISWDFIIELLILRLFGIGLIIGGLLTFVLFTLVSIATLIAGTHALDLILAGSLFNGFMSLWIGFYILYEADKKEVKRR